ncbi:uncharacterized protein LOC103512310 [Diaphorina citri]|uniref:Uncharacterized protein LOC103512310 n=1 Tax=Diaphorina citri TaxID=121845 RepID=A0A3Q0IZC3_DIACI|nr:uncharacterized protein LOC103512310 [Diaphorina citri]
MDHRNLDYLRNLISILETELRERENFSGDLHSEVIALRREVKRRDEEIARLETEVHKLKSVLQQTQQMEPRDPLSSLGKVGQLLNSKKQGVSGESSTNGQTANDIQIQRYDKDFRECACPTRPPHLTPTKNPKTLYTPATSEPRQLLQEQDALQLPRDISKSTMEPSQSGLPSEI